MLRFVLLGGALCGAIGTEALGEPPKGGAWTLTFCDEFDGTGLDEGKWLPRYQWGNTHNYNAYCDPKNVLVENGLLRLKAENKPQQGKKFTSAVVTSYGKFSQKFGYIEGRFRIPQGKGFWPAFWMLPYPQHWPPEIDILETFKDDPHIHMTYHWNENLAGPRKHNEQGAKWTAEGFSFSDTFHEYGVEWDAEKIVWYIDGTERARFDERRWIANEPMYLLINFGIEASGPGPVDETTVFPSHYECDWVKVWQRKREATPPTTAPHDKPPAGRP